MNKAEKKLLAFLETQPIPPMTEIYEKYDALEAAYNSLIHDYQYIREDTKLLDWVEENKASINWIPSWYERLKEDSEDTENGEWVWLPWRSIAKDTMGPPCATLREAIESLRAALGEE